MNAIRYAGRRRPCTVTIIAGATRAGADRRRRRHGRRPRATCRACSNASGAPTRPAPSRGTGLGLAIVKHVVTAAGGTVEASGAPGRGLEIVCRFPPAYPPHTPPIHISHFLPILQYSPPTYLYISIPPPFYHTPPVAAASRSAMPRAPRPSPPLWTASHGLSERWGVRQVQVVHRVDSHPVEDGGGCDVDSLCDFAVLWPNSSDAEQAACCSIPGEAHVYSVAARVVRLVVVGFAAVADGIKSGVNSFVVAQAGACGRLGRTIFYDLRAQAAGELAPCLRRRSRPRLALACVLSCRAGRRSRREACGT